ncbi:MAG TPA: response regulator transcription factor [Kouleothrix sp.]|uniref:response regulator n=1 Tax=Kouleothrix sp. TaxID=2779161 RepID=UPI002BA5BD67|nr:response regulator transcription factor [Kouleothrix sp.]HRC75016.1 response regulator transcription factor [Kouleothrix sp.]
MSEYNRVRVLVVDDHAVVRSGLSAFLQVYDDLELAGEVASGQEAIRACETLQPDVVLMDLVMPGMDGTSATRAIRQRHAGTQVIVLTSFWDEELVRSVLQAGAIGYILKNATAEELAAAVRAAHGGRPTFAPEVAKTLIQATAHPPDPARALTNREREVLALMIAGLSNTEIAERLMVSRSTIKFFVSSILAKLEVASRVEAVALAVQRNLVN